MQNAHTHATAHCSTTIPAAHAEPDQLKQIQALPQERQNVIKLQRKKPDVASNEIILACYGPIVEGAVEKIVLNKQNGTLLVWYKKGSRQFKARFVYLIRRLGMGSKPEWRWI